MFHTNNEDVFLKFDDNINIFYLYDHNREIRLKNVIFVTIYLLSSHLNSKNPILLQIQNNNDYKKPIL